jgi:hypothetical protein
LKKFRIARERLEDHPEEEFIIRLIGAREGDLVQYNLPTTDDLAMLIVGDFSLQTFKRDIVIEKLRAKKDFISSSSLYGTVVPSIWHCSTLCCFRMVNEAFNMVLPTKILILHLRGPEQP